MTAPMIKLMNSDSHFELVNGNDLRKKDIVQIYPKKVYVNERTGYAVFLCEVQDEEREEKSNGN